VLTADCILIVQIRVIDDDGNLELDVVSNCTYIAISCVVSTLYNGFTEFS
jgi:hypothetical protein